MATINLIVQSKAFFNITPSTGTPLITGDLPIFCNKWIEDWTEAELTSQAAIVNTLKKTLVTVCDNNGLVVADQKFQIVISTQFAQDPEFFKTLFEILPQAVFIVMIDFQSEPSAFLPNPN